MSLYRRNSRRFLNCRFCFSFLWDRRKAEKHLINHHPQFYAEMRKKNNIPPDERLLSGDSPVDISVGFFELKLKHPVILLERLPEPEKNDSAEPSITGRRSKFRAKTMIQNLVSGNYIEDEDQKDDDIDPPTRMRAKPGPKPKKMNIPVETEMMRKRLYDRESKLLKAAAFQEGYSQCPICERFYKPSSFDSHMRYHRLAEKIELAWYKANPDPMNQFQNPMLPENYETLCKLCLKGFEKQSEVLEHCIEFHLEPPSSYPCNQCDVSSSTIADLLVHMRNEHPTLFEKLLRVKLATQVKNPVSSSQGVTGKTPHCYCVKCNKSYSSSYKLKLHQKIHIQQESGLAAFKPFQCDVCGSSFARRDHFTRHKIMHTKNNPFVCKFPGCDKAFDQPGKVRQHMSMHFSSDRFQCQRCPENFKTEKKLDSHVLKYHLDPSKKTYRKRKRILATKCYLDLISMSDKNVKQDSTMKEEPPAPLNEDERHIRNIDLGSVDLIDKIVINESGESVHIKGENLEESVKRGYHASSVSTELMEESLSKEALEKRERMKWHAAALKQLKEMPPIITEVEKVEESLFKCDECSAVYTRSYALRQHQKTIHDRYVFDKPEESEEKGGNAENSKSLDVTLLCGSCGYLAKSYGELERHKKEAPNHPKHKYKFKCDTCGKPFPSLMAVEKHNQTIHLGERKFKCDTCGRGFANLVGLKQHKNKIHKYKAKRAEIVCDICLQKFLSEGFLKMHLRKAHSDVYVQRHGPIKEPVKSHECQLCHDKFATTESLRRHVQLVHLGKPVPKYMDGKMCFTTGVLRNKPVKQAGKPSEVESVNGQNPSMIEQSSSIISNANSSPSKNSEEILLGI